MEYDTTFLSPEKQPDDPSFYHPILDGNRAVPVGAWPAETVTANERLVLLFAGMASPGQGPGIPGHNRITQPVLKETGNGAP